MSNVELLERISALEAERDEAIKLRDEVLAAVNGDTKYERLHFIRDAAIAIFAYCRRHEDTEMSAVNAWRHAKALWDAKPEDC